MLKSIKRRLSSGHTHKCLVGIVEATWAGAAMGEGAATGQGSEGRGSKRPEAAAVSRSRKCWPRPERNLRHDSNRLTSALYFAPCSVHILEAQKWICAKKEKTYSSPLCPAWTTERQPCPARTTEPMVGVCVVMWHIWDWKPSPVNPVVIFLVKTILLPRQCCPTAIFLLQLSSRTYYYPTLHLLLDCCVVAPSWRKPCVENHVIVPVLFLQCEKNWFRDNVPNSQ